jgi:PTS system nitrogen regulatory IIA component
MYLNVVELAESMGVEEKVVEGWVRYEGLPHVHDRGRLLFDRAQVVTWAVSRGLAAKVGFLAPSQVEGATPLERMMRAGGVWRDVAPQKVLEVLAEIAGRLPGATPAIRQMLRQRVRMPNGISWAPVGGGLALPHLRSPVTLGRDSGILGAVLLKATMTVNEPAPDDQGITRLLFFIAPSARGHLELLAKLSAALTRGNLRGPLVTGASDAELFAAIAASESGARKGAVA